MRRLARLAVVALAALIALAGLSAGVALLLGVETRPRVPAMIEPTPDEVERLKRTLESNDPRRLDPGEVATLSLDERELAIALGRALAMIGGDETVSVEIEPGRLHVRASLELPVDLDRRFLNVATILHQADGLPRFERLRLGRLPVPAAIADRAWRRVAAGWLAERGEPEALEMIQAVAFDERRLDVTYRWQPWTVERVRAGLIGPDETRRIELYHRELVELTDRYPKGAPVPLGELLGPLFEFAQARSQGGDPVAENRAAIVVLGSYIGPRSLATWIPEAAAWPAPRSLTVTLQGEWDLATHFMTSAMVATLGGGGIANAVGLYKELADRGGGSGFSFRDLGADRAGTRLGELAVASGPSATRLQHSLREEASDSKLLPPLRDLPDGLSRAEFGERFGDVGSPEYERMTAEIDRRISALPLYGSR